MQDADVIVVGAGFGGLACALHLAERGARVALLEQLNYPGGCASTFSRAGHTFEAGATLFAGLDSTQLFGRWIAAHRMQVTIDRLDPLVTLRAPRFSLEVLADKEAFLRALVAADTLPTRGDLDARRRERALRGFFAHQEQVASALWQLFDEPELLPPLNAKALLRHATRFARYLPVFSSMNRSVLDLAARYRIQDHEPLRLFLNAVCQITVQCEADSAEAPFALSALDYFWRGAGHVRGGIGVLAQAMVEAIRNLGGEVSFADRAVHIRQERGRWCVQSRRGLRSAPAVVLNLLPSAARALLPDEDLGTQLDARDGKIRQGWGAAMLYRAALPPPSNSPSTEIGDQGPGRPAGSAVAPRHDQAYEKPQHYQLVADPSRPLREGNHVFVSVAGQDDGCRSPDGSRTMTASTHVRLDPQAQRAYLVQLAVDQGSDGAAASRHQASALEGTALTSAYVAAVQSQMRSTISRLLPEWDRVSFELTASPRTFQRFTGRPQGLVGGAPRTVGWANYARSELGPTRIAERVWLVGDSVFPGQSTLAVALGGIRTADQILARQPSVTSRQLVRTA